MGHLQPQTLLGRSRRELTGRRRKPKTQQVYSLLPSPPQNSPKLSFFSHQRPPCLPQALTPRPGSLP